MLLLTDYLETHSKNKGYIKKVKLCHNMKESLLVFCGFDHNLVVLQQSLDNQITHFYFRDNSSYCVDRDMSKIVYLCKLVMGSGKARGLLAGRVV